MGQVNGRHTTIVSVHTTDQDDEDDEEDGDGDDENDKELLENVFIGLANGKPDVNFKDLMDWDFVLDLFYEVCMYGQMFVCMYL